MKNFPTELPLNSLLRRNSHICPANYGHTNCSKFHGLTAISIQIVKTDFIKGKLEKKHWPH